MPRDPHSDILFEPLKIGAATAPNRFVSMPHAIGVSCLMPNGAIGIREMVNEGGWGIVAMQLSEIEPTSEADAIRITNATPYGLASALWTSNLARAHRMVRAVKARVVQSLHALDKYVDLKTAWFTLS